MLLSLCFSVLTYVMPTKFKDLPKLSERPKVIAHPVKDDGEIEASRKSYDLYKNLTKHFSYYKHHEEVLTATAGLDPDNGDFPYKLKPVDNNFIEMVFYLLTILLREHCEDIDARKVFERYNLIELLNAMCNCTSSIAIPEDLKSFASYIIRHYYDVTGEMPSSMTKSMSETQNSENISEADKKLQEQIKARKEKARKARAAINKKMKNKQKKATKTVRCFESETGNAIEQLVGHEEKEATRLKELQEKEANMLKDMQQQHNISEISGCHFKEVLNRPNNTCIICRTEFDIDADINYKDDTLVIPINLSNFYKNIFLDDHKKSAFSDNSDEEANPFLNLLGVRSEVNKILNTCGHVFHKKCLEKSAGSRLFTGSFSGLRTCPYCSTEYSQTMPVFTLKKMVSLRKYESKFKDAKTNANIWKWITSVEKYFAPAKPEQATTYRLKLTMDLSEPPKEETKTEEVQPETIDLPDMNDEDIAPPPEKPKKEDKRLNKLKEDEVTTSQLKELRQFYEELKPTRKSMAEKSIIYFLDTFAYTVEQIELRAYRENRNIATDLPQRHKLILTQLAAIMLPLFQNLKLMEVVDTTSPTTHKRTGIVREIDNFTEDRLNDFGLVRQINDFHSDDWSDSEMSVDDSNESLSDNERADEDRLPRRNAIRRNTTVTATTTRVAETGTTMNDEDNPVAAAATDTVGDQNNEANDAENEVNTGNADDANDALANEENNNPATEMAVTTLPNTVVIQPGPDGNTQITGNREVVEQLQNAINNAINNPDNAGEIEADDLDEEGRVEFEIGETVIPLDDDIDQDDPNVETATGNALERTIRLLTGGAAPDMLTQLARNRNISGGSNQNDTEPENFEKYEIKEKDNKFLKNFELYARQVARTQLKRLVLSKKEFGLTSDDQSCLLSEKLFTSFVRSFFTIASMATNKGEYEDLKFLLHLPTTTKSLINLYSLACLTQFFALDEQYPDMVEKFAYLKEEDTNKDAVLFNSLDADEIEQIRDTFQNLRSKTTKISDKAITLSIKTLGTFLRKVVILLQAVNRMPYYEIVGKKVNEMNSEELIGLTDRHFTKISILDMMAYCGMKYDSILGIFDCGGSASLFKFVKSWDEDFKQSLAAEKNSENSESLENSEEKDAQPANKRLKLNSEAISYELNFKSKVFIDLPENFSLLSRFSQQYSCPNLAKQLSSSTTGGNTTNTDKSLTVQLKNNTKCRTVIGWRFSNFLAERFDTKNKKVFSYL